jgi:hypothetical protein
MSIKKHLLLFLLKFAVVYIVLLLPPVRALYTKAFLATGNKVFRYVDEKGVTVFRYNESETNPDIIAEIRLMNKDRLAEAKAKGIKIIYDYGRVACNWFAYLMLAYLIALIAATPVGWKRKLWALATGLTLSYIYYLVMIWVLLLYKFNQNPQLQVLELKGFKKTLVDILYPVLVSNPGTTVFVALFIYALVVFRKADLERLKATLFPKRLSVPVH